MMRTRGRPKGGYIPDTERKPALQRIKERHRLLAKFVAAGLTRNEIAARLDMTPERVGQLTLDPAMQNLIAQFRDHPHVVEMTGMDEIALLRSVSLQNALRSALALQDNLNYYEDADERMPVVSAAKIFELSADRIGFGKHSTNINVNVDFAAQLDRAIDRSRAVRTISGHVEPRGLGREYAPLKDSALVGGILSLDKPVKASPILHSSTTGGGGPQLAPPVEGRGQELRGDASALSFTRRVSAEDHPVRARSVQGNDPLAAVTELSEPVKRRF